MSWHELSFGEITAAAEIHRFGAFDYAVPHEWMMVDPEKRRHYCWFYPHDHPGRRRPSSRPLAYRALARLAIRLARRAGIPDLGRYARLWSYAHPGKPFDAAGLDAIREWIRTHDDLGAYGWLFERLGIPIDRQTFAELQALAA